MVTDDGELPTEPPRPRVVPVLQRPGTGPVDTPTAVTTATSTRAGGAQHSELMLTLLFFLLHRVFVANPNKFLS